jgi:hypothetical protein
MTKPKEEKPTLNCIKKQDRASGPVMVFADRNRLGDDGIESLHKAAVGGKFNTLSSRGEGLVYMNAQQIDTRIKDLEAKGGFELSVAELKKGADILGHKPEVKAEPRRAGSAGMSAHA